MRDAARAVDDVSDHLGEVLHRADELLAEWSRFGAQVRIQVEREAAGIGEVVDGAVGRAASEGLDRAVADRLRALTSELERLEQRARTASRAVALHRDADRRVLWIVVAGIALANALLVVLLLRPPAAPPVTEPIRIESPIVPPPPVAEPLQSAAPGPGSGEPTVGAAAVVPDGTGLAAGSNAGSGSNAPARPAPPGGKPAADPAGATKPAALPVVVPPRAGGVRPHKKLP